MGSADKDKLATDLSAYLDGELDPARAREVEQFLAESEEARRTLAGLRAVSEDLAALPRQRAPEELADLVRRGAERHALLQEGPLPRQPRVLKLFARISASAALIAACVLAGWTVFEHVSAPGLSRARPETPAGRSLGEPDGGAVDAIARSDLPDRQRGRRARPGTAELLESPAAIAMAEKPEVPDVEILAREAELAPTIDDVDSASSGLVALDAEDLSATAAGLASIRERTVALGVPMGVSDAPAVNVVIAPRNAREYGAALRTVAAWQRVPPAAGRRAMGYPYADASVAGKRAWAAVPRDARSHAGPASGPQNFIVQVAPSDFNALLVSLDQQAPGQVQAAVGFNVRDISQVQGLVAPTHVAEALAEQERFAGEHPGPPEPTSDLRRAGGRGGATTGTGDIERQPGSRGAPLQGQVLRGSTRAASDDRTQAEQARSGEPETAAREREEGDAEALEQLEALGYADESGKGTQAEKLPSKVAEGADERDATGKGRPQTDTKQRRRSHPAPDLIHQLNKLTVELRTQFSNICQTTLDAARRAQLRESESAAKPAPVTLQVILLPPPPPATQPDVATSPQKEP